MSGAISIGRGGNGWATEPAIVQCFMSTVQTANVSCGQVRKGRTEKDNIAGDE